MIPRGLIVSCQAEEGDPFNAPEVCHALRARGGDGRRRGIRARDPQNIRAIRAAVSLPIIGLTKGAYADGSVLITPSQEDALAVSEAGADMIAVDGTDRRRGFIAKLHEAFPTLEILADISTIDEGIQAEAEGAAAVATTLSGYTPSTARRSNEPDWELLTLLVLELKVPVILEGKVSRPAQARRAMELGAHAVVVGSAITRPRLITGEYVNALR